MKKIAKISLIVAGSLVLLVLLVAIFISPIAKHYIEKNSKELVGRVVTIEKLRFNLFNGSLWMVRFDLKEQNEQEPFFTFDTLSVKVKLFDFLRHKVTVKKIHLTNAHVHLWQKGNVFNFSDMIQKFSSSDTIPAPPREKSKPWEIGIYDIQLRQGNILYNDLVVGSHWDLKDLNLKIPGVYFSGRETDVGFDLAFADGGALSSNLKYDIEKSAFRIHLNLTRFSIAGLLPYLQQSMRIGDLTGLLDANMSIHGDTQHIMNSVLQGVVVLNALEIEDDRNEPVVKVDSIRVDIAELSPAESKYLFNELSLRGLSTMYVMEKDSSDNFSYLFKKKGSAAPDTVSSAAKSEPAPMHLSIAKTDLRGIHVQFKDNTLAQPFAYELNDLTITAAGLDPDQSNDINVQGNLGNTGSVHIAWKGKFSDLSNLNLKIDIHSLGIPDFTPYSMEYFAYPITDGTLAFSSHNIIKNNQLKGVNNVDIFNCNVGKAASAQKPVVKVPLRLAVYVLKDRNSKINMSLPVEGDIRSPKFSYKKILLKTLTNLLVKVSLAPLDFLAGAMGFNAEDLEQIEFSGMQDEFTSAQYDKFNKLSSVVLEKPDLQLNIQQEVNYSQTAGEQSMLNLKTDFYLQKHPGKTADSLGLTEKAEIALIKDSDPELMTFADSRLEQPGDDDIYAKASALYKDRVDEQMAELANLRNHILREYLITRMQVPAEKLSISTLPREQNKVYTAKSAFKISLSLPGEEPLTAEMENVQIDE